MSYCTTFRDHVEHKVTSIHPISINDQPAEYLTKALNEEKSDSASRIAQFYEEQNSKIYKSVIREVLCKEPFKCKAEGLYQFLKDILDRADE